MEKQSRNTENREQSSLSKSLPAIVTCAVALIIFVAVLLIVLSHGNRMSGRRTGANSDSAIDVGTDAKPIYVPDADSADQTPEQTAAPDITPTAPPTETVSPTQSAPVSGAPVTPTPKPTVSPSPSPTPESTPTEPPEQTPPPASKSYTLGKLTFSPEAYAEFEAASAKSKLSFRFYAQNPDDRGEIKSYRHDGMSFSEWKERINDERAEADRIFSEVKNADEKTEYNVDISEYSWTDRSDIEGKYGEYFKYLPREWFEHMDYYITNEAKYKTELESAYRSIAENDAVFLKSRGAKVSVHGEGREYYVECTATKTQIIAISESAQDRYRVTK